MGTPKVEYVFNPFTGTFDAVRTENLDVIVTHELNSLGRLLKTFDDVTAAHINLGPIVTVDNNGNVVVMGD